MLDSIYILIMCIFLCAGLVALLSRLLLCLIRPKKSERFFVVLPMGAEEENAVVRISYYLSQAYAVGDLNRIKVIALDLGIDNAQLDRIYTAYAGDSRVSVCMPEGLNEKLCKCENNNVL